MEIVSLNFGQCGLQLANVYWTKMAENVKNNPDYRNVYKCMYRESKKANVDSKEPILERLVPRAILVDAEMGPATQVIQDSEINLISSNNIIAGTDSAGNNWATAFKDYGAKYSDTILELVEHMLEDCEHPEYFNITFGVAGGTGSGLGTYTSQMLAELYPKIPQVATIVASNNVSAVSPYNNLLALSKLQENATMIVPFSNEMILESIKIKGLPEKKEEEKQKTYFEHINKLISDYQQKLNIMTVDDNYPSYRIKGISNTLIPFEKLNYTSPFKSPIKERSDKDTNNLENVYNELFRGTTRIAPIPQESLMSPMTVAIISDGTLQHMRQEKLLKLRQKMYGWNREGLKFNTKNPFSNRRNPHIKDNSIIALSNHTGISQYLDTICSNVETLLKKKAFLHHFENLVNQDEMKENLYKVEEISKEYKLEDQQMKDLVREEVEINVKEKKKTFEIPKSLEEEWPFNSKATLII